MSQRDNNRSSTADDRAARRGELRHTRLIGVDLLVPTREGMHAWKARLDDGGEPHGGMVTGQRGGTVLVCLDDPDGIEIRPLREFARWMR